MSKRVRTLLRVSSKQQLHEDDIPVQRAEAASFIASRSDWVFDGEYMEKAVSAYKNTVEDREILQKILSDARKKEFEVLLTYMSDRIGRKEEYSVYVATLNNLGIEVWTIKDGQLKTEEHIDRLLNFIRFWQNEGESKKTSMRVRDAQKEMVQAGKFTGGKAPFGYRLVLSGEISNHGRALHKLEIAPKEAAIVQKIYSLAIQQGMGAEKIAKQLNTEKIPAITTDKWKSGTISGILKNPVYMGYPAVNRRINHGSFTRLDRQNWTYAKEQIPEIVIVSQKDWERAQELREARKRRIEASKDHSNRLSDGQLQSSEPFSTSGRLPLIGIVSCGYCGAKLKNGSYNNRWFSKKEGIEKTTFTGRYCCPNHCGQRSCYSQKYMEGIVFEVAGRCMERFKTVDIADEISMIQDRQKAMIEKEIYNVRKRGQALEQDIETLNESIPQALRGDSLFSAQKLSELIKDKETKLSELKIQIKEAERKLDFLRAGNGEPKIRHRSLSWKEEFERAETSTKQMLLSLLIQQIEVKEDEIKIRFRF